MTGGGRGRWALAALVALDCAVILLAIGSGGGTALRNLAARYLPQPAGSRPGQVKQLSYDEFRKIVDSGSMLIIDTRPPQNYKAGHAPHALNLPYWSFQLDPQRVAGVIPADRDRSIALYCFSPDCQDSDIVAQNLQAAGYSHLCIFKGGWREWTEHGAPEEK